MIHAESMKPIGPIAWYITPHGNGHAVRSCDILSALCRLRPEAPVEIVSRAPEPFLRNRLPAGRFTFRHAGFDVGMIQRDSVQADLPATLDALRDLERRRSGLIEAETAHLRAEGIRLAVCDIPAFPIEAAARLGIPRLATGNFSWNWIYEHFAAADPAWRTAAEMYRRGYGLCDLLLRQPFHEPMEAFPRIEDVPVLASPGAPRRAEIAARYHCPADRRWVLLSFSSLHWPPETLARLEAMEPLLFLTVKPLEWPARRNFVAVDRHVFPFCDVLASADAVLTKPGFGIVSECVVNAKPMVYAERPEWPESAVLESAIARHLRAARVTGDELYAGRIEEAVEAALRAPSPPERVLQGGAPIAARRILEFLA